MLLYEIVPVFGHFELYIQGEFYCSTDTYGEAITELKKVFA